MNPSPRCALYLWHLDGQTDKQTEMRKVKIYRFHPINMQILVTGCTHLAG